MDEAVEQIRKMRGFVEDARTEWVIATATALNELATFAKSLELALGDISRDEAVDALKKRAAELIEAVR